MKPSLVYLASRAAALALVAVVIVFSAASTVLAQAGTAQTTESAFSESQSASASRSGRPVLEQRNPRYRLCASDVITLTFPLTPEFNQTVTIQPDGFASLTGAGDLHLEGLTTDESTREIRKAYANVLHDPIVTLDLKDFNKPYFVVGGQVHQPGKYDLRGYTTATQAIALAGGFNEAAKHSQVLLFRRVSNDWCEVKNLNLKKMLRGPDIREDPEIRPGDMLFVPQNTISKVKKFLPNSGVGTYYDLYR